MSNGGRQPIPNQTRCSDPNQTPVMTRIRHGHRSESDARRRIPNKVPAVDPNKAPDIDPNQVPDNEPNAGLFNKPGNLLIADQLNHRVIEVDRDTHEIVWQFGDGNSVAGPKSVVAPQRRPTRGRMDPHLRDRARREHGPERRARDRPTTACSWSTGRARSSGSMAKPAWRGRDANQLNTPVYATFLPYGHILITDQGNHRVIEVSLVTKRSSGSTARRGSRGRGSNHLNSPSSALWLDNGNILIADQGNNRVIEVNRRHRIVWRYGDPRIPGILNGPAYACRLPDGHTLITDSGNNRDPRGGSARAYGHGVRHEQTVRQCGRSPADGGPCAWKTAIR